ncbi:MAG: preprotein translocase subunit SecA [Enterobacteriaceae bacterium PC38]|nr:MAG: preprotein translocase subunit SecA [Enterobacteriaceae bacterium PC38]
MLINFIIKKMIYNLIKILLNKKNFFLIKKFKIIKKINDLEPYIKKLSNKQIKKYTIKFKKRIKNGETLKSILPEAFAIVRETSKRLYNMRHFNIQLLGGIILNERCIAEMKTGEGKTLTSTLTIYLNALKEKGVHIITVNDYLTKRDAKNNKLLFEFLNLKVGINLTGMTINEKKKAYNSDITYGTSNEFGFDYLKDNMIFKKKNKVQRNLYYALIDEIDSILIDESRTPLVISYNYKKNSNIYFKINKIILILIKKTKKNLKKFYKINYKNKQIYLTEYGLKLIEKILILKNIIKKNESLYSKKNIYLMYHINNSLSAHFLFNKNIDYILKKKKIKIIDEYTGRIINNRKWSDGLHQAIETKENICINNENKTLSFITFQKYFLLYKKISGMTGTAYTEYNEFKEIYNLKTIKIPSNCKSIRKDKSDRVYITKKEKFKAIIKKIKKHTLSKQPLLIGTITIKESEKLSKKLNKLNIKHQVLNAHFHSIESNIISKAGKLGSITIATNMAGRGTDIILGGNLKIKNNNLNIKNKFKNLIKQKEWKKKHDIISKMGGLYIIGTERYESRRIDNQLIGRSGRQGDPGTTRFYLSFEDKIINFLNKYNISNLIHKFGFKKNQIIENKFINKLIKKIQKKNEIRNFKIRKELLKYDNVNNKQRNIFYNKRNKILNNNKINKIICNIIKYVVNSIVKQYIIINFLIKKFDYINLEFFIKKEFYINFNIIKLFYKNKKKNILLKYILIILKINYLKKKKTIGNKNIKNIEKYILLKTFDMLWKEYLYSINYLKKGIYLYIHINKNPIQEYKRKSFYIFCNMLESFKYEIFYIINTIIFIKI